MTLLLTLGWLLAGCLQPLGAPEKPDTNAGNDSAAVDSEPVASCDWYADGDGDGFGDEGARLSAPCQDGAPEGHVEQPGDCDDADPQIHPDADERCNGLDDDCDGETDGVDAVDLLPWYIDSDGDGFGDPDQELMACDQPSGSTDNNGDCDDSNAEVHPEAEERCNDLDDNCDGSIDGDDAVDRATWYRDADGDGWGVDSDTQQACDNPGSGWSDRSEDCDDGEGDVNPGQTDWFDAPRGDGSYDYNCDGSDEREYPDIGTCSDSFGRCVYSPGFYLYRPSCGELGRWVSSCNSRCQRLFETGHVLHCR